MYSIPSVFPAKLNNEKCLRVHYYITIMYLKDRRASGRVQPSIDEHKNVQLLAAMETETHTVVKVSRPIRASEPKDLTIKVQINYSSKILIK